VLLSIIDYLQKESSAIRALLLVHEDRPGAVGFTNVWVSKSLKMLLLWDFFQKFFKNNSLQNNSLVNRKHRDLMKSKVTVLTTVYNGSAYLNEAIESVLNQTYNDFEFLIIDDTSTDNSVEIINSYKDSRIRLIKNEKNIGQTASLNIGLKLAKGKYIARLDQDDVCLPKRLEEQVDFIVKNSFISIVSSWEYTIDSKGRKIGVWKRKIDNYGVFLGYILLGLCPVWHPSVMFIKDDILKLGGFDTKYGPAEDYELWSRIAMSRLNGAMVPQFHLLQRCHDQSQSIIRQEKQLESLSRAHNKAVRNFIDVDEVESISSTLRLDESTVEITYSKDNILLFAAKIKSMLDNANSKQKLSECELKSLKTKIYRRIGYGFAVAPSIRLFPKIFFYLVFYSASPMYLVKARKYLSSLFSLKCRFPFLLTK
jgi:glycosyltransferase involved in cell wall biosynthesis